MNRLSHAVPVTLLLAIASAARAQVLYWTEGSNTPVGGGQIWRANLDGTPSDDRDGWPWQDAPRSLTVSGLYG